MGFGWVALGFAFAFGNAIYFFQFASAHLNPAFCLTLWINNKITGTEFLALSAAEFAGAFIGACLVWLHFMPHFKTVPQPSPSPGDELVHPRDVLSMSALRISSFAGNVPEHPLRNVNFPREFFRDASYWVKEKVEVPLLDEDVEMRAIHQQHETKVEVKDEDDEKAHLHKPRTLRRRRSIQVADLQRRIQQREVDHAADSVLGTNSALPAHPVTQGPWAEAHPSIASRPRGPTLARANSIQVADLRRLIEEAESKGQESIKLEKTSRLAFKFTNKSPRPDATPVASDEDKKDADGEDLLHHHSDHPLVEKERERIQRLYEAAVEADKKAKLSIFATRPAIYSPFWNFYTEMAGTASLCCGALLLDDTALYLPTAYESLFKMAFPFLVSFLIFCLVLGQGGPTGYAANPARDFGPRLAHFVLPIHGKGQSEWGYAWVPFFGCFAGGAVGGILYKGFYQLRSLT
eukprot:TRINITY_DN10409_c0_g1_i5.p1 TRINITY_DN10409_c0_g1~~TRINITY_DN10409_c0_g1_i5.p1  ORF type:complete len:513 (-),score=140.87 TRINITY_DN10409_c0_g1_i5:1457-2845(-)